MEPSDVKEVKTLLDNLQYLEKILPNAIQNWTRDIKTCNAATIYMSKGLLKKLCERPGILHDEIFVPLYSFLNTYIANREKRLAFTGKSLDTFLRKGLRAVKNYIVIADFFAKNPQYFVPDVSYQVSGYDKLQQTLKEQNKYKDFIFTVNEYLIGCKNNLNFLFLELLSTVKNLTPELAEMKSYLSQQCDFMRIERLKM